MMTAELLMQACVMLHLLKTLDLVCFKALMEDLPCFKLGFFFEFDGFCRNKTPLL